MMNKDIILQIQQYFKGYHIVLWESSMIGRYSPYGDVDVYVIGKEKPNISLKIPGLILDIEYLDIEEIKLWNRNKISDLNRLKILYKILTGVHIQKIYDLYNVVNKENLLHYNQIYWSNVYVSLSEDIVKFEYAKNHEGNLFQIFYLIEAAEAIFLTKKGIFCIKRKWIHTDFLTNFLDINYYEKNISTILEHAKNKNFEKSVSVALKLGDYLRFYQELKGGERICE